MSVGRNDPCPCGSGKKYKHCCMRDDEDRARFARNRTEEPEGPGPMPGPAFFPGTGIGPGGVGVGDGAGPGSLDLSPDQMTELMLRQTGFSSQAELEAAMSRYQDYCEGVPDDARIPTFMEYLGRANPATDMQRDIVSDLKDREFADEEELQSYLSSRMESYNAAPVGDFEGLSPERMGRILHGSFDDNADLVVLNPRLADDLALQSELVATMRYVLEYLVERRGKSRLTDRGNFPRELCRGYLERFSPEFPADRSVPSEIDLPILDSAHRVLIGAGYIEESASQMWVTEAGSALLSAGAWGRAFGDAFVEVLYYLDWQEQFFLYEPQEEMAFVQLSALFLLYLLARHPRGSVGEVFDRICRAFPEFVEHIESEPESMAVVGIVVSRLFFYGCCKALGLTTLSPPEDEHVSARETRYETTELFRRALVWKQK